MATVTPEPAGKDIMPARFQFQRGIGCRMGEQYLEKIKEFVFQRSRLSFNGHKRVILRQKLENRLEHLSLTGFGEYWDYLRKTAGEEARLFDCLTTNETYFFRNPDQFSY